MTEKRCHICGKEVTENYYLDSRGYTCYLCSKTIMNENIKSNKMQEYEMIENKRYVVIVDTDLEVSLKDNITKKYPFSLVCENIDDFESLLNEVINVCAELNKNWEQTLRFEDYNKELTQRSIKYEDTIDELKHENKELRGKSSSWKITASEEIAEKAELVKENVKLKQKNRELEELVSEVDNELEIRDTVCRSGKFRLEEWGKHRYHQFYKGDEELEDESVVIMLMEYEKENKKLKLLVQNWEQLDDEKDKQLEKKVK